MPYNPALMKTTAYLDGRLYMAQSPVDKNREWQDDKEQTSLENLRPYTAEPQVDEEMETLPYIYRSRSVAPSYQRQLRSAGVNFPSPGISSADQLEYEVDNSAGVPSVMYFRKNYSLPLTRSGSIGGHWRHITQVTGQSGSNLLFIEGTVKQHDVRLYPPYGMIQEDTIYNNKGQRLLPRNRKLLDIRASQLNSRAKSGFEYWYKEPSANITRRADLPRRTISGRQLRESGI